MQDTQESTVPYPPQFMVDDAHSALDRHDVPRRTGDFILNISQRIDHLGTRAQVDRDYATREGARVTRANDAVRALTAWIADQGGK